MTDHVPDDLRERFQAMKRADAGRAPAFQTLMARARSQSTAPPAAASSVRRLSPPVLKRLAWGGAGALAAAAVVALVVVPRTRASNQDAAFEQAVRTFSASPAMGAWRSPTDGLLDVPGSSLISTTPSVQPVR
jgi:hypothetical protein